MKTLKLISIILVVVNTALAQKQEAIQSIKSFDALYSDIMSNLPSDMKSKVDSAKMQKSTTRGEQNKDHKGNSQKESSASGLRDNERLNNIPEHLQLQVQKALEQIETNNRCKNLEFMDNQKKMNCYQ